MYKWLVGSDVATGTDWTTYKFYQPYQQKDYIDKRIAEEVEKALIKEGIKEAPEDPNALSVIARKYAEEFYDEWLNGLGRCNDSDDDANLIHAFLTDFARKLLKIDRAWISTNGGIKVAS